MEPCPEPGVFVFREVNDELQGNLSEPDASDSESEASSDPLNEHFVFRRNDDVCYVVVNIVNNYIFECDTHFDFPPGSVWVPDLTVYGIEPNPGPVCHNCGKNGHIARECHAPKAKRETRKTVNKNLGPRRDGQNKLAASVREGLAAVAGASDADKEKDAEAIDKLKEVIKEVVKTQKDEEEQEVKTYTPLLDNNTSVIEHKYFDHPDFIPTYKVTSPVRILYHTLKLTLKLCKYYPLFGSAVVYLLLSLLMRRMNSIMPTAPAFMNPIARILPLMVKCFVTLPATFWSLGFSYGFAFTYVLRHLKFRTTYATYCKVLHQDVEGEMRPERMHHQDLIKYRDPKTVKVKVTDKLICQDDFFKIDEEVVEYERKRQLNVSMELFSQFSGYTMVTAPTKEFYMGLQRDIKRTCSIGFDRMDMARRNIFNDTATYITAWKLSEMTKRDSHEHPLN